MEETNKKKEFKTSATAKMALVGVLTFALLIPLYLVQGLVAERKSRHESVVKEINSKWGEEVLIYGPMLKLVYSDFEEIEKYDPLKKEKFIITKEIYKSAYMFPETLAVDADVVSEPLSRGNFKSAVFKADMKLHVNFGNINLQDKGIDNNNIHWDKTKVVIKTTNLKGIKKEVALKLKNQKFLFEPNFSKVVKHSGKKLAHLETKTLGLTEDFLKKGFQFDLELKCNGSDKIHVIPVGRTTLVNMKSNWINPSFIGEFLPTKEKKITKDGFQAQWEVLGMNRPFSQKYLGTPPNLIEYTFGTNFLIPLDEYQKTERSTKYGVLIIGLTLIVFFLIQIISKINIHLFQYSMVGIALVLFYTLLLSISEHTNFNIAYIISTASVVCLITLYSSSIFKSLKFTGLICGALLSLYSLIYVIIQLENYALLFGSIGLFIVLAIIMFTSRKIEWEKI